jgi:hypothetical protein
MTMMFIDECCRSRMITEYAMCLLKCLEIERTQNDEKKGVTKTHIKQLVQ